MSKNTERKSTSRPMGGPPGPGAGGPSGLSMGGSTEKAKNFTGTWAKLIGYCKNYLSAIVISLVFAAVGTVLQVFGPDKLSDMTNEIMKGLMGAIDLDAVASIVMVLVLYYALSFILSYVQSYIMATTTARI